MSERIGTVPELRSSYRNGATTPVDRVERVLAGLAGRDGGPVWISTVPAAELRARAEELTRHHDPAALPLYGIRPAAGATTPPAAPKPASPSASGSPRNLRWDCGCSNAPPPPACRHQYRARTAHYQRRRRLHQMRLEY
ncbi:hypothetical protein ACIG87_17535 [Micromonospora sp. NPDC051925]|uniref:hypothetical protein n=1 Tax=Micromonospora sp. NPDC051925 TaxID=3364288 RepID=UPI0037C559D9